MSVAPPNVALGRFKTKMRVLGVVLAFLGIGAVAQLPIADAAFLDTTNNGLSTFTAASCLGGADVQSGVATNAANGTQTVSISAVDPAASFLLFTSRHNSNRPVGSVIGGHLANATTLEFHRATNESSPVPITINWHIVEYSCGLSVQRGITELNTNTVNQAIAAVGSVDDAFVTFSRTVAATDGGCTDNDLSTGRLTSTSNLRFVSNDTGSPFHSAYWQVIEFTDPAMVSVQHGTTSIGSGSTSVDVTLPTAVDLTKTFALTSVRGSGSNAASTMVAPELTSATNLHLARGSTDDFITELAWQVIELHDGSSVQHGDTSVSAGTGSVTETIAAVDLSKATAFTGGQMGSGQNGGTTPFAGDDITGSASAMLTFNSTTQLAITRDHTVDSAVFPWFVVEWGS